jgi:hypothetical protein
VSVICDGSVCSQVQFACRVKDDEESVIREKSCDNGMKCSVGPMAITASTGEEQTLFFCQPKEDKSLKRIELVSIGYIPRFFCKINHILCSAQSCLSNGELRENPPRMVLSWWQFLQCWTPALADRIRRCLCSLLLRFNSTPLATMGSSKI